MSGTGMIFASTKVRRDWHGFDGAAPDDLVGYGLLDASRRLHDALVCYELARL